MVTCGASGLLLAATMAGAVSAQATPTLTVTPTTTTFVPPNSTTALAGLSISGDTADTLQATVSTDIGTLTISTTTNLTLAYNNQWSGHSAITFTGLQSDVDAALASTSVVTGNTTGEAHISLTALVAVSGVDYLPSNQHFYEYVASPGITWTQADADAQTLTFNGQPGYLATIPDSQVDDFISNDIASATDVWFGARAYESSAIDGTAVYATVGGVTYGRVWRWTVGASESPIQGQVISECDSDSPSTTCSFDNSSSFYSSWANGEPNNYASSEYVGVTNWGNTLGAWNDLSPTNTSNVSGYVVEFGGKTNVNPSAGTGFSGVVTATSSVTVASAPTVPAAPTITGTAGANGVRLSWTPPSSGGAAITSYQYSTDNGVSWHTVTTSSSSSLANGNVTTTVSATVAGLSRGVSHNYEVRAVNSVGASVASNVVAVVLPAAAPGAPTGVSARRGNGSATVSFTAPSDDGGAAITGYLVTVSPGGATVHCAASPCVVHGLTNGKAYTFSVRATNSVGTGAASPVSVAVTPVAPAAATSAPLANSGASVQQPLLIGGGALLVGLVLTWLGSPRLRVRGRRVRS
jgi:hypothetical protein